MSRSCQMPMRRVVRCFAKCSSITMPTDGSRDSEINIENLSNSKIDESHDVRAVDFYSLSSDESSHEDHREDEKSLDISSKLLDTF